jgi:hypothetical protein
MLAADVLDTTALSVGLFCGAIALVVSAVVALFVAKGRRPGVLGLPVAVAALLGVRQQLGADFVPPLVFGALALLALGGVPSLFPLERRRWILAWLAYVPGAIVLACAPLDGVTVQSRITVAVMTFASTVALVDFERAHGRDGFALLLLPLSAIVPATMIAGGTIAGSVLLGALLPVIVMALPRARARFGAPGLAALMGAYFWVVLLSANDRPARFAAAFVGLGFLLFEPVHRFLAHSEGRGRRSRRAKELDDSRIIVVLVALLGQGGVATYCSLVAARESTDTALLALVPIAIVGVVLARAFVPSPRRFGRQRQTTS